MIAGYVLTNNFQIRAVTAVPMPDRPSYYRVGKRIYRHTEVYVSERAAIEAGERILARLGNELDKRKAELHRRAGYLRNARAALGG